VIYITVDDRGMQLFSLVAVGPDFESELDVY